MRVRIQYEPIPAECMRVPEEYGAGWGRGRRLAFRVQISGGGVMGGALPSVLKDGISEYMVRVYGYD
jgi:hypothetical protein